MSRFKKICKPTSKNAVQYGVRKALDLAKVDLENLPDTHIDDHLIASYYSKCQMRIFDKHVPVIKSKMGYVNLGLL